MEDSHFESFEFFFLKISSEEGFTVPCFRPQVMPILPVSRIFTDEELDEHQFGSLEVFGGGRNDRIHPWKIIMEHNQWRFVSDHFPFLLSKWVICR